MAELAGENFAAFFEAVHGDPPFPWQRELARRVVESGSWPPLLDLPTGAGKTAAIDIAVFHLACEAGLGRERRAPLRILFVIDRRIVVDEATSRGRRIAHALARPDGPRRDGSVRTVEEKALLRAVSASLLTYAGDGATALDVVRLRGGVPQERDWARTPAQPLVAVSTVDQVGSRLLFRGYGVSPRMWPVHAGLVGADALWLLDEVHLSQPLEETLDAIERGHPTGGEKEGTGAGILAAVPRLAPFAVVRLSGTPGKIKDRAFSLSDADRAEPVLAQRLQARKVARLAQISGIPEQAFAEEALRFVGLIAMERPKRGRKGKADAAEEEQRPASRVAVVVNRVDAARRVFRAIEARVKSADGEVDKADIILLTGRVRPLDRERILGKLVPLFAKRNRGDLASPMIVVATQTIEAGADLDVNALVTEIAPLDSLRQRFGRLDRLGDYTKRYGQSRAVVFIPKSREQWKALEPIYGDAPRKTAEWLDGIKDQKNEIDFGIDGFEPHLRRAANGDPPEGAGGALDELLAPRSHGPVLLPAYVDLWAMTSPVPAATPEPALFLHGPGTSVDVTIIWRADIDLKNETAANLSLELCPPSSLEALPVPIWAAQRWLRDDADEAAFADVAERSPEAERPPLADGQDCLRYDGTKWSSIKAGALRPGDLIVVPACCGGCDEWGWNPERHDEVIDLGAEANYGQRRKGVLRITPSTLRNGLLRGPADDGGTSAAEVWGRISGFIEEVRDERNPAETLVSRLVAISELPLTWLRLLRGMTGARLRAAGYGDDWAAGFILYAERPLEPDLLDPKEQDEADPGAEALTDRKNSSDIGAEVPLFDHLRDVEDAARRFARRAGLNDPFVDLLGLAARLHDIGKAEPRFQADLRDASPLARLGFLEFDTGPLLAKSARGRSLSGTTRAVPENFRHESLSVALAERHPHLRNLKEEDRELVLWLIGTHHGYGRPFFPPVVDGEGDIETVVPEAVAGRELRATAREAPIRLDQGWFELAMRVRRRFGPWELARLEAIIRLADHAASAMEARGSTSRAAAISEDQPRVPEATG